MSPTSRNADLARMALDALPQAMAILSSTGEVLEVNRQWRTLHEASETNDPGAVACGDHYLSRWESDPERQKEARILAEAFATALTGDPPEKALDLIYTATGKQGERYFRLQILPTDKAAGCVLLTRDDITEEYQKKLRARTLLAVDEALALRDNTDSMARGALSKLHDATHANISIIFLWDEHHGTFIARHIFGGSEEARHLLEKSPLHHGHPFGDLMKKEKGMLALEPDQQEFLPAEIYEPLAIKQFMSATLQTDNQIMGVLIVGRCESTPPLEDNHLRLCRAVGRRLAYGLENANLVRALADASRLKSEFVATMSHELRTPLHVVLGYADLLRDEAFGTLNDEQKDSLQRIERSGSALLELINETLNLSQLDAGEMPISLEEVDLQELFRRIASEGAVPLESSPVAYRTEIPTDLPTIFSDRSKLEVIVRNLLSNAFKFTTEGYVRLAAEATPDGVWFSVQDTGLGMSRDTLQFVFEPFRQGADPLTRKVGGAGLGLHLVERYTQLLGGKVAVESTLGEGSFFRIQLPRRPLTFSGGGA
jgi:signal transduction histidine kinase